MKKILKYTLIAALAVAASACGKKELDTNPLGEGIQFGGLAPNPVMRGAELRILGSNLDQVSEVRFAGDVSVTDIEVVKAGNPSEIRVIVPLEGPEVGPVTIVGKDGVVRRSQCDLTYTEPIEVASFSPAEVLSGDVVTIKGEYLNVVREVIFAPEVPVVEFVSQSRHELKVLVPASAVSGPIILSDVNELVDENTIPNHIYTEDLTVGKPTVVKAGKTTYKSGDVITVTGEHLDMIESVNLNQANDVEFKVAEDASSLWFNLPLSATDGNITLVSFAGDSFDAGEIETVTVTELFVASLAEDGRFKAGCSVEITGTDLDLVSKVEFTGAEVSSWYLDGGKILATMPDAAKDGAITVTLESGKQAYSEDIEVVKPVVIATDVMEAVAGEGVVIVSGTDLDLVTSVVIGNKEQSFIDCEFSFENLEDGTVNVAVNIADQAYTGPLTLTSAAGYETVTGTIEISYNEAVSITFDEASVGLGNYIGIHGRNLLKIDQLYIKGKRVTDFALRADDAMSFGIPEGLGPGVYRLSMLLMDGTELTWPVPFSITAPFTETFIWQGSQIINGWAGVTFGDDRFIWEALGAKVGDVVKIYYTAPETGWWDLQLVNGHWGNLSLDELNGGNEIKQDQGFPGGAQTFSFNITEEVLASLTEDVGWGGAFIINGDGNVEITGISLIQFGAAEKRETIWEGNVAVDWSGSTPGAEGAMTALSWGGYDWASVEEGTVLALAFDRTADEVQIRVSNGSWAALPGTEDPYKPEGSELKVELTGAMLAELVNAGGLVVTGQGFTLKEVALLTTTSAGPVENAIWEGSSTVTWSGGAVTDLSWGGYDWSTVEPGTVLCAHYTIDDPEGCIRFGNGSWASIPSLSGLAADGNLPLQDGGHEVELTADDLAVLVNEGGLVICGTGFTITQIGLK